MRKCVNFRVAKHRGHTTHTTKLPKKQIDWMVRYMQAYGWWMIFAFACWPSMFFDMCGLCAGLLKVDTPTFLSATAAGKVVKSCVLSATLVLAVQALELERQPHLFALWAPTVAVTIESESAVSAMYVLY